MEDKNPIQVAGRVFAALEYLAGNGPTGLMELSAALQLNKTTVYRALRSLEYMGYVRQDPKTQKYEATFKLVDLSGRIMARVDVNTIIHSCLTKLSELTGETIHFVERDGSDIVYLDKIQPNEGETHMISHVGSRIPFYRTAVGKAIAARMPEAQVKTLWDSCRIERMTPYTITNFDELMEALSEVRRRGYALDNEENESGVRCIGAAVTINGDDTRYAFSISAPLSRMDNSRIRELSEYILAAQKEAESRT